jgi:predicted 3-demethylubiquinone-9 3-methyltransferase (glyoxalase superfamily)
MTSLSTSLIIPEDLSKVVDFYTKVFGANVTVMSAPASLWTNNLQSAVLKLYGHTFTIFNLGPEDKPSPATSFMITCDGGQQEIDTLWSPPPTFTSYFS